MDKKSNKNRCNIKKLAIIVPIHYEEKNIENFLNNLKQKVKIAFIAYFIYDDINDPTIQLLENIKNKFDFKIKIFRNAYKKGVLNALKTGIEIFEEEACVITMADCSDDLSTINKMNELFYQGFDVVCGSRYMKNGKQVGGNILKKILSYSAGLSLYYLTNVPTRDITNNFKLYSKKLLNSIKIESSGGFELGIEITAKAYLNNFSITEIPTTWIDRLEGKSKFKLIQWFPYYLKWYFYLIRKKPFFISK